MGRYQIALLPGDGIGPEVMAVTTRVLSAVASGTAGLELAMTPYDAGCDLYRRTGVALPDETMQVCKQADAVLLSALGLPDVRKPDGTEIQPEVMMGLRWGLGLFAAARPIKLYPGVPTALRDTSKGIDFVVVRENSEGLFASYGGGMILKDQVATDTIVITREGTEKVSEFAFRLAEQRRGRTAEANR